MMQIDEDRWTEVTVAAARIRTMGKYLEIVDLPESAEFCHESFYSTLGDLFQYQAARILEIMDAIEGDSLDKRKQTRLNLV